MKRFTVHRLAVNPYNLQKRHPPPRNTIFIFKCARPSQPCRVVCVDLEHRYINLSLALRESVVLRRILNTIKITTVFGGEKGCLAAYWTLSAKRLWRVCEFADLISRLMGSRMLVADNYTLVVVQLWQITHFLTTVDLVVFKVLGMPKSSQSH